MELTTEWLGRLPYREAWDRQRALVQARESGAAPDTLLLVEHDAVLTLGRHADENHVLASPIELARRGIEVIRVERGGEVTYHGPGQLVAYPIVRLRDRGILLRPFVRALEASMADVAASYAVTAAARAGYPGVWVEAASDHPRKLGALGLRLERGITYHGIALNITTDLTDFELVDPCGMAGLDVTSIARELGWSHAHAQPSTESVAEAGRRFAVAFRHRLAEAARATARDAVAAGTSLGAPSPAAA
jgi:lipoyl(octanoyl) transferase